MLSVIVAEALHALTERAKQVRLLTGFVIENVDYKVTHLQFADDTIVFCDASAGQVETLKLILKWFELLSGLKINYEKCEFFSIKMEESHVASLASVFGCRVGKFPSKYLRLPLYLGLPKKQLWDSDIERIDKKLNSWKGKYLSLGACITLLKSALSSIPIYYLSCFRCPKSVIHWIEKIQRDFLWNDSIEKRRYHLVRWEKVCKATGQGGLGIRSFAKVNNSLLGKWLWRIGEPTQGLWCQILIQKYKGGNNGWDVPSRISNASGFWKSILSVKEDFIRQIHYRVHDGHRISFWHDEWCGKNVLYSIFPNLYLLDRRQKAFVAENFQLLGGAVVWDFGIRRNLTDREISDLTCLLGMLSKVYI